MAVQKVTGPSSLAISSGSTSVQAQYFASKTPATWSVQVISEGSLSPGDYTVAISTTGLLTVTLAPGVIVPAPGTSFSLAVSASAGNGNGNNDTLYVNVAVDSTVVPCFVSGTRIATLSGEIPIERLAAGDKIQTANGETTGIRWIGSRYVSKLELNRSPKLCPVRIAKDAFAKGIPNRDLFLSPLHRVQISGWNAQLMFGERNVLAHASHLPQSQTTKDYDNGVRYFHILCDKHEVIFANGLPAETLFAGDIALSAFGPATVDRIAECLSMPLNGVPPQSWRTALPCLKRCEVQLIARTEAVH